MARAWSLPWTRSRPPSDGAGRQTPPQTDAVASANAQEKAQRVEELKRAAAEAVECGRDTRKFVNESEPTLGKLHRAVQLVRRKKYADEQRILNEVLCKDEVVHFVLSCARNRFVLKDKVVSLKEDLCSGSAQWDRAFQAHTAKCSACATVDLRPQQASKTPEAPLPRSRRPVPFVLELLALLGVALPSVALGQGCGCALRWWLALGGLLLCLPLLVLGALWRWWREELLWRLVAGRYVVGANAASAPWMWAPTRELYELQAPEGPRQLPGPTSFGHWWCYRRASASTGQSVGEAVSYARVARTKDPRALSVTCDSMRLDGSATSFSMDGTRGVIQGLPRPATFDGNAICLAAAAGSQAPNVWVKGGIFRLEWIAKLCISLAGLGLLTVALAAAIEPGLTLRCFPPAPTVTELHSPMNAVFLLDASYSITDSWELEKETAAQMISAFDDGMAGTLRVGATQFSDSATVEVPLTSDVSSATTEIRSIDQIQGGTNFEEALRACQEQLDSTTTTTVLPTCGQKGQEDGGPRLRIVNGEEASPCEWGWQVSLRQPSGFAYCGGTLISDRWVLTAAHCEWAPGDYVVVGDFDKDSDADAHAQRVEVVRAVTHPDWEPEPAPTYDFELLELAAPVELGGCVTAACLPSGEVPAGTDCMTTGWGTLSTGGPTPDTLQEAPVEILSTQTQCSEAYYGNPFSMGSEMMCAQGRNPSTGEVTDACQGDSGGPLVCQSTSGQWVLHGVTSFGGDCADPDVPGVWARVSEVTDWIQSVTDVRDQDLVAMDAPHLAPTSSQDSDSQALDLCVLITDGQATAGETDPEKLRGLVASSTRIVGIYVGSNSVQQEALRQISSCAGSEEDSCPFFASASDFAEVQSKATALVAGLTALLADEEVEVFDEGEYEQPLWSLCGLLAVLPAFAWWCYLHCRRPDAAPPPPPPPGIARKDPLRLRAAGRNSSPGDRGTQSAARGPAAAVLPVATAV